MQNSPELNDLPFKVEPQTNPVVADADFVIGLIAPHLLGLTAQKWIA